MPKTITVTRVELVPKDVVVAHGNWRQYQDVFEHQGVIADNPLLASDARFRGFLHEYSVGRTIRSGSHYDFKETLRAPSVGLGDLLEESTGTAIDSLDSEMRPRFGTHGGTRGLRSGLSKIAAFLRPDSYIAWDRFARAGLNRVVGRPASFQPPTYREYLSDVRRVLRAEEGRLRESIGNAYPSDAAMLGDRFLLRVLDVALMRIGGRTFS